MQGLRFKSRLRLVLVIITTSTRVWQYTTVTNDRRLLPGTVAGQTRPCCWCGRSYSMSTSTTKQQTGRVQHCETRQVSPFKFEWPLKCVSQFTTDCTTRLSNRHCTTGQHHIPSTVVMVLSVVDTLVLVPTEYYSVIVVVVVVLLQYQYYWC